MEQTFTHCATEESQMVCRRNVWMVAILIGTQLSAAMESKTRVSKQAFGRLNG